MKTNRHSQKSSERLLFQFFTYPIQLGRVSLNTLILLVLGVLVSSCATNSPDPYENLNRRIYSFNDTADQYVLRPIAQGYAAVLPNSVEAMIVNFFNNLGEPLVAINQLLQGKVRLAAADGGRFLINSTLGIGGFFDVAEELELPRHEEDIGQTLAVWGVGQGPYIVLPLFGPSSFRGAFDRGAAGSLFLPRTIDHVPTRNSTYAIWVISQRAELLSAERLLRGDRYLFLRDAYLQRRDYLINDGVVDDPFLNGDD